MKLKNFFQDILKMPYHRNYAAASGKVHNIAKHEDAVEDVLIKHGFTNANLPNRKGKKSPIALKDRDKALADSNELLGIPNNSYVVQPCGTHANPDFIVNHNNKLYFVECKSSKEVYPTYNSGLPKDKYIYIFSSAKTNATTVYMGDDIVTEEQTRIINEGKKELASILSKMNAALAESDILGRGVDYYDRPMFGQKGGADKSNYFTHKNRKTCEEKVIKYVS